MTALMEYRGSGFVPCPTLAMTSFAIVLNCSRGIWSTAPPSVGGTKPSLRNSFSTNSARRPWPTHCESLPLIPRR
jgi:hypothetical protein